MNEYISVYIYIAVIYIYIYRERERRNFITYMMDYWKMLKGKLNMPDSMLSV